MKRKRPKDMMITLRVDYPHWKWLKQEAKRLKTTISEFARQRLNTDTLP